MNLLQEIESLKYHFVLDLKDKEEVHDKAKKVITAEDAFKLCYRRYLLMQKILKPLMEKIGGQIDITDISFINGIDDDMNILIKYQKEEKQHVLSISCLDYQDIQVVSSDDDVKMNNFADENKKIIIKIFKDIISNSLYEGIVVKSTSGKIIINSNCDGFNIKSYDEKIFSLSNKYSDYEKKGSLLIPSKIDCNYPKLKELLLDENTRLSLFKHIYIYEDMFPKELIKKIN